MIVIDAIFPVFRVLMALTWFITSPGIPSLCAVALEVCYCVMSWTNLSLCRERASSPIGALTVVLYALSYLVPAPSSSGFVSDMLMLVLLAGNVWVLWHLRYCYTSSSPSFVHVVDSGPYEFIRHPQLAGVVLFRLGLLSTLAPDDLLFGVVCFWVLVARVVLIVFLEEHFLRRQSEYADYSSRVGWRLLPGVW